MAYFNLYRSGTTPFAALRADIPVVGRVLRATVSIGVLRPDEGSAGRHLHLLPEAQLQLHIPVSALSVWGGAGIGYVRSYGGRFPRSGGSLNLGVGAKLHPATMRGGIVAEIRGRTTGTYFEETITDYSIGVVFRF
jgi:hypothetical protein